MSAYPISHLSFSSTRLLMTDEFLWNWRYIRGNKPDFNNSNMAIGSAVHKYLECHYTPELKQYAEKNAIAILAKEVVDIEGYQKALKSYKKALEFWFAEEPDLGETIATEQKIKEPLIYNDFQFPIDLMCVVDRLARDPEGRLNVYDYKVVGMNKAVDSEAPDYILQAMFNYFCVLQRYGEKPYSFTFLQIKKSKNKDKTPQVTHYKIVYDEVPHYIPIFVDVIKRVHLKLAGQETCLPNFFDMMSGKDSWAAYLADLSLQNTN